jgi:hypothetical protein
VAGETGGMAGRSLRLGSEEPRVEAWMSDPSVVLQGKKCLVRRVISGSEAALEELKPSGSRVTCQ